MSSKPHLYHRCSHGAAFKCSVNGYPRHRSVAIQFFVITRVKNNFLLAFMPKTTFC
ncbi:MAG: hypothetical protein ACTSQJ_08380 [Promethearchaeota archaeon]